MSNQKDLIELQQVKSEQRGKTIKAIVVTAIAIVWLVYFDPTDIFPVVGWIDDGGLLYCAFCCIRTAVKYKHYVEQVYRSVERNVSEVENKAGQVKHVVTKKGTIALIENQFGETQIGARWNTETEEEKMEVF